MIWKMLRTVAIIPLILPVLGGCSLSDRIDCPPRPTPRVLMIGDSISMGYHATVVESLGDEAVVVRPAENCAGTSKGLEKIDEWLALDGGNFDIIHVNFGLHDLKRVKPDGSNSNDPSHPRQAEPRQYADNLRQIVVRLGPTGADLVFATTTPVPPGVRPMRSPEDAARYNALALAVLSESDDAGPIAVNDLYAFSLPILSEIQNPNDVHFSKDGSRRLGEQVAASIREAINRLD